VKSDRSRKPSLGGVSDSQTAEYATSNHFVNRVTYCLLIWLWTSAAFAAAGISNQATAQATVVNGFIVDAQVVSGGDGYFTPPAVTFKGAGQGAAAVAQIQQGKVVKIVVTAAGAGYNGEVRVEIGPSSYPDVTDIGLYAGITLIGQPGTSVQIQYTSTLDDVYGWQPVTNFVMHDSKLIYFDPAGAGQRYYRSIRIPTNPNQESLTWIPAGSYEMGSPAEEPGRQLDESRHTVTIREGFFMSRLEVTQADFLAGKLASPSVNSVNPNQPVENVSWNDAMEYCISRTQREQAEGRLPEGYIYRLPTEAEWEYAARAQSSSAYFFGPDASLLPDYAWFTSNAGIKEMPVGQARPNPFGLFDIYGNVSEWCLDWYGELADHRQIDPSGPETGTLRVVRGGGWSALPEECRSASRTGLSPSSANSTVGFRVVLGKGTSPIPTNPLPARLVWIPPGKFNMGSPQGELGRGDDELQHQVALTKGFWVGKYPVTVAELEVVTGIQTGGRGDSATSMTHAQAVSYCAKLTSREQSAGRLPAGFIYRLPTEAEWEYMARSGAQTRFYYGDDLENRLYCTYRNCNSATLEPVGARPPNQSGIYDIGNLRGGTLLFEWCSDYYGAYRAGAQTDPKGPSNTGAGRVVRGNDRSAGRRAFGDESAAGLRVVLARQ